MMSSDAEIQCSLLPQCTSPDIQNLTLLPTLTKARMWTTREEQLEGVWGQQSIVYPGCLMPFCCSLTRKYFFHTLSYVRKNTNKQQYTYKHLTQYKLSNSSMLGPILDGSHIPETISNFWRDEVQEPPHIPLIPTPYSISRILKPHILTNRFLKKIF